MKKTNIEEKKNTPLGIIKSWFVDSCVFYTLSTVVWLILGSFFALSKGVAISQFLLFVPAALTVSVGIQIYKTKKFSKGTRYFASYCFTVFGIYLFILLPSFKTNVQMGNFLMFLLISLIYWIIFLLYLLFSTHIKKLFR